MTVRTAVLAAAVAVLAVIVYAPALAGGFVWDDDAHVTRPELRGADGLRRIWTEIGATQQYYPVTHSFFWVQARVWGDSPFGYHLTGLVLHLACALLAWRVLLRLRVPGAGIAAVLFAVHPVHVESVAWVSEQKNTLSGVLGLSSVLLFLHAPAARPLGIVPEARPRRRATLPALAVFAAALLAKSVVAMLPLALLVLAWWRSGRPGVRALLRPLAPFLVLAAAAGALTTWVEAAWIGARGTAFALSAAERLCIAGRALWFYARTLVAPVHLAFVYPRWTPDASLLTAWLPLAGVVLAAAALWRLRDRIGRAPVVTLAVFAILLAPALGFVNVYPFRFSFVANHFQYLATLAPLALIGAGVARLPAAALPAGAVAVLALVLAVLGAREARLYTDAETLWTATLRRNPRSAIAHTNLGVEWARRGRLADAIAITRRAIELEPDAAEARVNLGSYLDRAGWRQEAIEAYRAAAAVRPGHAPAHYNLAGLLARTGRLREALSAYERAVAAAPRLPEARFNRAVVLLRLGRVAEAASGFRDVLRLRPTEARAWLNLGVCERRLGRPRRAADMYRMALRLEPDNQDAAFNLAVLQRRSTLSPGADAARHR